MFQDASQSFDPRSIEDKRLQPWRQWWPYRPHDGDKAKSPVLVDISGEAPWIKWKFNNDRPWEKPWIDWPLSWSPKYYGHSHVEPGVYRDPDFIEECLKRQIHHPISVFDPPRTTSFVQFFKEKPDHVLEKPYALRIPVSGESLLQSNFEGAWSKIMVTDVRGHEDLFSLDKDGFAWLNHTCQTNVLGQSFDVQLYMREMSDFLCHHFNAREVFIYDYVRRSPHPADRKAGFSDITRRIHCDQSPRSAIGRIKLHMGDQAEELLKNRCRIFSLWRPMLPVIEAYPLMACTYPSTVRQDIVPIDVVYPHYAEESFEIRHSLYHQWFWKSGMTNSDVMLIKLFDNKMDPNTAFYAPHGSWRDPNTRKDAPPRRSIELRCMVFGGN